jgi:hypothetical protein
MMKTYPMPANFDGAKFAARYGLNALARDFWCDGLNLHVPDNLPDDPPIFEAPDSRPVVLRKIAAALAEDEKSESKLMRALLAALLDELNLHASKINSILSAVDAATSLADLKTRVGLIADYPQRTMAQAVSSIKNKINAGDVD